MKYAHKNLNFYEKLNGPLTKTLNIMDVQQENVL